VYTLCMPTVPLNSESWSTVSLGKPGKILTRINPPMIAYFRAIRNDPNQTGPTSANEYIASRLGSEIGLPMAKIEFINHEDSLGTISFLVATNAQTWSNFPFANDFELNLNDVKQVADMIVFDTWIQNDDRNQENLMNVKNIYTKKYDLYFIDNTESLYGSPKPTTRNSGNFSAEGVIKIDKFKELLNRDFAFFEPSILKVESIQDDMISSIIEEVPAEFILDDERKFINEFIKSRKAGIRKYFEDVCKTNKI